MIGIKELIEYLDNLLNPKMFEDHCPNGLQVDGKREIQKIVTGVTACQLLLDQAIIAGAQAVLVHHGYFWEKENPTVTGIKYQKLLTLLTHHINLIAYHLPLDMHPIYGNNIQLAEILEIDVDKKLEDSSFILTGKLKKPMNGSDFAEHVAVKLDRQPLYIEGKSKKISTIAWCSGSAQDLIEQVLDLNVDAYLTGEVSERTVHIARESGIHFFSAGHHATERYGIKALGEHIARKFSLNHQFIDIDNPV